MMVPLLATKNTSLRIRCIVLFSCCSFLVFLLHDRRTPITTSPSFDYPALQKNITIIPHTHHLLIRDHEEMPPKTGPALFLGLELATDQLRASIVDESLELVGVECVDFDSELPEYQYVPCDMFYPNFHFFLSKILRLAFFTIFSRKADTFLGHREAFLLLPEMHIPPPWTCG